MTPDQYRREGFRAGIEAAAEACADYPRTAPDELEWTHYDEQIAHSQACIRAIDVDEVLAKLTCPECNGSGMRDSGGVSPWGEYISVPCDCAALAAMEANDDH